MTLLTGKRPATYDSRDIRWTEVRRGTNASQIVPSQIPSYGGGSGTDFGSGVWPGWGMYGNGPQDDNSIDPSYAAANGGGNCVWAGAGHETSMLDKNAGRPVAHFTCKSQLEAYAAWSAQYSPGQGYDLQSGANDNGTDVRSAMGFRQKTGITDINGVNHKILIYVSLEVGNLVELQEADYIFDCVGIGIQFPTSAMDQFNANQMWGVVPGATIEGGHYVPILGHPEPHVWTCVTWAKRQTITPNFLNTYMDEAWAYLTVERYNAVTGETPQGYKDADLEKFIAQLPQAQ